MTTSAIAFPEHSHQRAAKPRLLLMSKPPHDVLDWMKTVVALYGLDARLGNAMFDAANWHQSWSGRYDDTPALRELLRRVGGRISASAFMLPFNRIGGQDHWALMGRGRPAGFQRLLQEVRTELMHCSLDAPGHTVHTTISYRAPSPLKPISVAPIAWWVDEILLVCGHGAPYHYEVIDSWQLAPPPPSSQSELF